MLKKEATERIEILQIYEHPWMVKYRAKAEKWSDDEGDESESSSLAASNISFDKSEQDDDEDSQYDGAPSGEGTPNSMKDSEIGQMLYKKIHENNYLQN